METASFCTFFWSVIYFENRRHLHYIFNEKSNKHCHEYSVFNNGESQQANQEEDLQLTLLTSFETT